MPLKDEDFLLDVWSFNKDGNRVYPYKGERGGKKGLFSVNFTNDTNNFEGYSAERLNKTITNGKFKDKGTIRMLPLNYKPGAERNAFKPKFYKGTRI